MGFDFAIFGASPLAVLLGGLLATAHGKSVCLIAEQWSPWTLPRRFDIAAPPATRPGLWSVLKPSAAETTKLFNGIGKGLVEHLDPLLVAETPASLEALAHMHATVSGLGYAMERAADRTLIESGAAWMLRDVPALVPGKAEAALSQWFDRSGGRRIRPADAEVAIRRDGSVRIRSGGRDVDAAQAILADDAAMLTWLDETARNHLLREASARTVLTEPAKPLAAPYMRYLDRGVTLSQRGKSGITAIATGEADAAARIGSTLAAQAPLRRAADVVHKHVETGDGAPLIGFARGTRTWVVAGLGGAAAFFAPAIARHLAGKATEPEAVFFAAHEAGRGNARLQVADFVAEP
ncbi:MAG TPA: hypothetical protein VIN06_15390, partial [Devosia sp.]